jgi:hypothetical protein
MVGCAYDGIPDQKTGECSRKMLLLTDFVCFELTPCSYRYSSSAGGVDVERIGAGGVEAAVGGAAAAAPSVDALLSPGQSVILSSIYAQCGDAEMGPLKPGVVGTIVKSETEGHSFNSLVRTASGDQVVICEIASWYLYSCISLSLPTFMTYAIAVVVQQHRVVGL